jgi:hypothetical protein
VAYDEGLAQRVHELLAEHPDIEEKKMFGGLSFMVGGNLACGIIGEDLIVRVGPDNGAEALAQPHTRPFDFTGRPMKGWVVVEPSGLGEDEALAGWVGRGVSFASSLPPK